MLLEGNLSLHTPRSGLKIGGANGVIYFIYGASIDALWIWNVYTPFWWCDLAEKLNGNLVQFWYFLFISARKKGPGEVRSLG